jgi:hypothetical protein
MQCRKFSLISSESAQSPGARQSEPSPDPLRLNREELLARMLSDPETPDLLIRLAEKLLGDTANRSERGRSHLTLAPEK